MRRERKWIRYVEPHSRIAMSQRGVSKVQAEALVRNPDIVRGAKNPRYKRFEKKMARGNRLAVIVEETGDTLWVVSTFWITG